MKLRLISASGVAAGAAALLLAAGCGSRPQGATGGPSTTPQTSASSASGSGPGSSHSALPGRPCPGPPPASPARSGQVPLALNGVQFVSSSTGWVVGSDRILRTTDGGGHWATQYSATASAQLTSVDFTDVSHGWVVGAATILATSDGGAHWSALPEPCEVIRSVHFVSPELGFAVAGSAPPRSDAPDTGGVLLRSTDGGRHWRLLATPASVQTACFSDPSHGWLGAGGSIYGTANAGQTWTRAVQGPDKSAAPQAVIAQVQCARPGAGWAELIGPGAAMNHQPHVGYHTAGTTWQPIFAEQYFPHPGIRVRASAPGPEPGPFSAISADDAVFIDFCGPCSQPATPQFQGTAPMDVVTHGGATLVARGPVSALTQADGAAFLSVDEGWVVGTQTTYPTSGGSPTSVSKVMHTTDGGESWQVQYVLRP